ncbi:DUF1002 domain-containing protein [Cytobacillus sp. FJAT-54145]|uniref:DUF1002 domain-containing protein n=1 Tax=Cytobacillus spartinae TaxID=3299023 RepID=A0ABW6KF81_9BACI
MALKHFLKCAVVVPVLAFSFGMGNQAFADSNNKDEESINEKYGLPIVVYGDALSEAQQEETRKLLEVKDRTKVTEITVTGEDLVYYIDGDKNSNMYSSAKITRTDEAQGVEINIVTPDNITEVTSDMYANALLTAGVTDAIVDVASPVKVSGHSALVGIYKAYDEGEGSELSKERTEVANEELGLATDLAKKIDEEKVSELLTEIKKQIAEQSPQTQEEMIQIIDEQLKALEIQLSDEDRQLLIDLFEKMRDLNINFDNVKSQLEDLSKDIQKRIEETIGDPGFMQAVADFFRNLIESIKSIFS